MNKVFKCRPVWSAISGFSGYIYFFVKTTMMTSRGYKNKLTKVEALLLTFRLSWLL